MASQIWSQSRSQIRAVTVADAPAIQAIYAPYVTDTIISFETTPPSVDEIAARIQKVTSKYPWLVYIVDEIVDEPTEGTALSQNGGQPHTQQVIAGYVYASTHHERAAYQWSVDVSVYINPKYHRRNIGRGLYTALFELLRAQGFVNAYAGISLPNAGSVGIHEAMGFEPVGVFDKVGYKFGGWHDVGYWALRLREPSAEPSPPTFVGEFIDTPLWSEALQQGLALIRG
jgi:phosphinothricin acetyltransferase